MPNTCIIVNFSCSTATEARIATGNSIAAPKVGGSLSSILSAMELPVAILASVAVLHEKLTILQVFGIVIVLIGMTLPTVIAQRKNTV